jgi:fimbrial chaperone protein
MRFVARIAAALLWLAAGPVVADEFSVSPTSIRVAATEQVATLTVVSGGPGATNGQVRVMRWRNENGRNDLEPTRDVTASPPSMHMKANQEITIRLVRKSKKPVRGQECYRVLIDKLPNVKGKGPLVAFTVRQSVPLCFGTAP